jgi:uncharacterized protein (TIGR03118 family)
MKRTIHRVSSLLVFAGALMFFVSPGFAQYSRSDLVSNVKGLAAHTDTDLVNGWGIAFFPTSPIWVSDEASGLSTLYDHQGKKQSLVVTIPSPSGVLGTPTGIVANGTSDFVVSENGKSGPGFFIFDTEDGSISGWNPTVNPTNAVLATSVPGAFFTGLAIGSSGGKNFLFAADQANNVIDILDSTFTVVGSFTDASVPPGLSAFNVQNINGLLYVTFAGFFSGAPGGVVDVFGTDGTFIKTFTSQGHLNGPWGLAMAPANFGPFSNDLLVGNLFDGRINAFDPNTGAFLGQLRNQQGQVISIDGLWGLRFGAGTPQNGKTNDLFFTAGPVFYSRGLLGVISPTGH